MTKGAGLIQAGSFRALKMLYEESNAAFEALLISAFVTLLALLQHLNARLLRRLRFALVMWPRTEISTEK